MILINGIAGASPVATDRRGRGDFVVSISMKLQCLDVFKCFLKHLFSYLLFLCCLAARECLLVVQQRE